MTVTTKQQVISLLEQNQRELRRLGVRRCGLFGSFVRDDMDVGSDVDILVRQFKNETHQPQELTKKGSSGIV